MAGKTVVNTVQLGDSGTATQNFVLKTNADGTAVLARGNDGATTQDILTIDSTGFVSGTLKSSTAIATTSGTSHDFTGIPAGVKKITVMFSGVSTNGGSFVQIQIGAGSLVTTGYAGYAYMTTTAGFKADMSSGFVSAVGNTASSVFHGQVTLGLMGSNVWTEAGIIADKGSALATTQSGGSLTLGGTLDRIRITTVNGTDTFDAGSVNILCEG